MGFATIGIVAFMRQALKLYYADRAEQMINRDIRSFTNRIEVDAVTANYFCIYPNFSTRSTTTGSVVTDAAVTDGQVGDMLVLVYADPASASTGVSMITRIVGYYREVTDTTLNNGPVRRFDITISPSINAADTANSPMYKVLNTYVTGSISSYPIVTQIAQGLSSATVTQTVATPPLFYNRLNRSIMISAQITASLTEKGITSQTGNTYNFTVSPRG